jgi:hypothetical protein
MNEQYLNNIAVLRFAEARQPEYRERKGQGYIEFGELNDYPDYLLDLFNKSAKHNAIVKGKVNYITGNGWKSDNPDDATAQRFIDQPNAYESLAELTRKISLDVEIFGGAYLDIVWSVVGGSIASMSHIDYTKVRTSTDNTSFWYKSDGWRDRRGKIDTIPAFNPKQPEGRQILYIKEYRPGLDAYALPGYLGALNYIESDIEVSKHVLGNAQTGFNASKLITLPNGTPPVEEQRNLDRRFRDTFGGSDGKKFMISFVDNEKQKPIIEDLGASDLTKEDFGRVDTIIQQNIFAGHQITTPTLFGIQEPGQLGTRSQMRDAYEIFKNTYVNDKQQYLEVVFTRLLSYSGSSSELEIIPVEPIALELSEAAITSVAPREWILEKAGIDESKYITAPTPTETALPAAQSSEAVNDNLRSMSGRQWQQMTRIVREFSKGKITREQASMMLRSGYGLSDEEVNTMIGAEEQFDEYLSLDDTIAAFREYGEHRENFDIVQSSPLKFADITEADDVKILEILQRQPLTPPADIAKAIRRPLTDVEARIKKMVDMEVLATGRGGGLRPTRPVSEIVDEPSRTRFEIRYSYEWKSEVPTTQRNTEEHPSRPFCVKLMDLDRYWTRREIETLSQRLGYSVFDRGGGWWGQGVGKPASPSCRHEWRSNVVIRKKK